MKVDNMAYVCALKRQFDVGSLQTSATAFSSMFGCTASLSVRTLRFNYARTWEYQTWSHAQVSNGYPMTP